MRYVVTELEGFANDGRNARTGLSVQVIDTATCHRIVKSRRSEDYRSRHGKNVCKAHSDLPAREPLDDRYLLTEEE